MFALINARIYDYHQYIESAYIIFDEKIVDIGSMDDFKNKSYDQCIDCQGKLVIPGFVTGHTHLYSTFARGLALPFHPNHFLDILKQMWWKIDHFLDLDMIYYSALMGGIDQLKHGTTSLIDHHASGQIKGALHTIYKALNEDLKLKSVLAFETSDRFDLQEAIDENMTYMNKKLPKSRGLFGMHASLSLSDESLKRIKATKGDAGIHIHVAESLLDEERCIEQHGMRVVERLDRFGLINDKALLVHCTHIDEKEMDIIKDRKATIAINPTSNLNNAVGISKVKAFLDKGIRVILGNDGLLQSQAFDYLNTYYLGHLKTQSPIGFTLDDLKKIMVNTYAFASEILGVELGPIHVGAQADLLVIDYKPYTPINDKNAFGHLFFGVFPGLLPEDVFANGYHLIDQYKLKHVKETWFEQANLQSRRLWQMIEKEGDQIEFRDTF